MMRILIFINDLKKTVAQHPRSKRVRRILSGGFQFRCNTANRIPSVTFHQIPITSTVFLWYPLIGFTAFRSDSYSRNRSDPILGSLRIRRDSGSSGTKNSSEFAVLDDTGFHAKTSQLLASELVGLDKSRQVPSIGVFRIWQHRSDRNQSLAITGNNQKILQPIHLDSQCLISDNDR